MQQCVGCPTVGASNDCATFHPATPLCGTNGACVECLGKDNCDAKHQTCNMASASCAPCAANADCTSGLCNAATGACADKATLLYVNNAPTGCSDAGSGSFSMPFCTAQKGLNASAASGKTVVVFGGIVYPEALQANTTLTGGNDYVATAVGIGSPQLKPTASGPVLKVLGTAAKQVTVSLDGFIFENTLADGSDGIDCNGSGAVYGKTVVNVARSTVKGSSGMGISLQAQCSLTADSVIVTKNQGGGIKLDTSDFTLTNALVNDNGTSGASGSAFGGINITAAGEVGKMTIVNCAIINNKMKTSPAGFPSIGCGAALTALTNTVIVGNTGGALEFMPSDCGTNINNSAFGGATGTNEDLKNPPLGPACTQDQLFVDPTNSDFHPRKGGTRPCTLVDQGTPNGAPTHDLDGAARPRPAGGNYDIGCYEVP